MKCSAVLLLLFVTALFIGTALIDQCDAQMYGMYGYSPYSYMWSYPYYSSLYSMYGYGLGKREAGFGPPGAQPLLARKPN